MHWKAPASYLLTYTFHYLNCICWSEKRRTRQPPPSDINVIRQQRGVELQSVGWPGCARDPSQNKKQNSNKLKGRRSWIFEGAAGRARLGQPSAKDKDGSEEWSLPRLMQLQPRRLPGAAGAGLSASWRAWPSTQRRRGHAPAVSRALGGLGPSAGVAQGSPRRGVLPRGSSAGTQGPGTLPHRQPSPRRTTPATGGTPAAGRFTRKGDKTGTPPSPSTYFQGFPARPSSSLPFKFKAKTLGLFKTFYGFQMVLLAYPSW